MTEVLNRKYTPPDNSEEEKQQETERSSQEYLKLAKENPHKLTEEIKKNPKTEPLLRRILGDAEYERIKDLNPNKLSEDTDIAKMQGEIYSFVDINPETDRNPTKEKFIKGLIDSIIVGNAELTMKIIETKGAILKNMIQEIFSWEGLKNIAEGFGKSVMELFSGDAYKTGKSLGELGLITVGSGAGGFVLKRLGKGAIKTGESIARKAEKETIASQGLQKGGKGVETLGKVVQAPYNIAEAGVKKAGGAIRDGVKGTSEIIANMPSVQKVTEPLKRAISESKEKLSEGSRRVMEITKERTKEVLSIASVPILVGSKDGVGGIGKLRGQIGAVGDDISKIKPFDKENGKSVAEESKVLEKEVPSNVGAVQENTKARVGEVMNTELELKELIDAGLPKDYVLALQELGVSNREIMKFKGWDEKNLHREIHVRTQLAEFNKKAVETNQPLMTLEEAHTIFGSTTNLFSERLNSRLWNDSGADLKLAELLKSGTSKMPKAAPTQYRGDKLVLDDILRQNGLLEKFEAGETLSPESLRELIGTKIRLKAFSSSSDNVGDSFWNSPKTKYQIEIQNSDAHDITPFALFPNFGNELKKVGGVRTNQESVFLPGAEIRILEVVQGKKVDGKPVLRILVRRE